MSDAQALSKLQNDYAIYEASGEIWGIRLSEVEAIIKGQRTEPLNFFKKTTADCVLRRYLENLPINCDPKTVIKNFWINPQTMEFKGLAFSPLKTPDNIINLWVGNTAEACGGNWETIHNYLLYVVCAGNNELCEYLICYMAHMLQKPQEKPGVMLVFLGSQGTGKGTFFRLLKSIWGRSTLQVNDVCHVVDNFNAELETSYAVCMDEALFVGDKKKLERLKSLITEPTCRIEQKYQPSRTIHSFHRFFAASNNEQFAHIDKDDRRFVFFKVSDTKKCDTDYFNRLDQSMVDPQVIGGLVQYLTNLDINNFNVRARPKTHEQLNQKIKSLTGFERYWFEVLQIGNISGREYEAVGEWPQGGGFVTSQSILGSYTEFDKSAGKFGAIQSSQIAENIKKLCPSGLGARKKNPLGNKQVRGYLLPGISIARKEFEAAIGHQVDWDEAIQDAMKILEQYSTHEGAHP